MTDNAFAFSHAVLPENGEDSFALRKNADHQFLCIADGCGGLGSRRYPALDDHTGAYAASRLATHMACEWSASQSIPTTNEGVQLLCRTLEQETDRLFRAIADEKCRTSGIRITGSMQRCLPTTFCAALTDEQRACFLWAGDSRACVLDANGLHQCTADHLKGSPDPFESLYRDTPLSAYLCADTPAKLSARCVGLSSPCAVVLATDGAYNALPTPMEFEMLLLDTLKSAKNQASWKRKLETAVARIAQDDATLAVCMFGAEDFEAFKQAILPRRETLQKQFITPVRRKKGDVDFARGRWQLYRPNYDWTQEERHG